MRVEKIDIKKEIIDIPKGKDRIVFVERPSLPPALLGDGDSPLNDNINIIEKVYFLQRFYNGNKVLNYLIQLDDRGIFNDLVKVSNNQLAEAVYNRTSEYRESMKREIRQEKEHIKRLPWWKRLFNKF